MAGGEGGIRTPDRLAPMPHFECGAFDHSATSPENGADSMAVVALQAARSAQARRLYASPKRPRPCGMVTDDPGAAAMPAKAAANSVWRNGLVRRGRSGATPSASA